MPAGMSDQKDQGSCHCGAVRYAVTLDLEQLAITCNFSMCQRAGTMLMFAPMSAFKLEKGGDHLTSYKFNRNVIDHLFCKTCGIKSFARGKAKDGSPTAAINVRCLEGVDATRVKTQHYDGKAY